MHACFFRIDSTFNKCSASMPAVAETETKGLLSHVQSLSSAIRGSAHPGSGHRVGAGRSVFSASSQAPVLVVSLRECLGTFVIIPGCPVTARTVQHKA